MQNTRAQPALATPGFVEQFQAYVERWIHRLQNQSASASAEPAKAGRPRELPAEVLWSTLLLSVLQRVRGVREVWRAVVCQGYDICDQAVYTRLDHGGTEPLQAIFAQVSRMLAAWVQPLVNAQSWDVLAPFAHAVLALDETTLDPLARKLPSLRHFKKGTVEVLPGKLATLFDVRLQLWQRIASLADVQQNCKVHARAMLEGLSTGTLLLFDLGYFGGEWLDELTMRSLWYVSRLREKTSYTVVHTLYESEEVFDALVWLGKHQARAGHVAQLVRVRVGCRTHMCWTHACSRWTNWCGCMRADGISNWRSCCSKSTCTGILQQLWACLIIAQLLQAMRMEIAVRAHVDPFEVSMA
jgi:hypothetical protein